MYRNEEGALLAVGLCDETDEALSTMYFYFEPSEKKRSLGTFSALMEIEYARERGLGYYYLGYWIPHKQNMAYKAKFKPAEVLCTDSLWRKLDESGYL